MNTIPFVVVDVETGGLDADKSALLEIAAIVPSTGYSFHAYITPRDGAEMSPYAIEVNGLTPDHLKKLGAISEERAIREFCAWLESIGNYVWAGANPAFDWAFVHAAIRRWHVSYKLDYHKYDIQTVAMYHHAQGKIELPVYRVPSPKVDHLITAYGVDNLRDGGIHGGMLDVTMEAAILQKQLAM